MELGKIFLSHSSQDKDYVEYIANYFGKDRCVYDAMCFEAGMKTLDEIVDSLKSSDIFVFFISNNSLDSPWVKQELSKAGSLLYSKLGHMLQFFPIMIDPMIKHDDSRIPEFMREGGSSLNLKYIASNLIACKKIQAQFLKRVFEIDDNYKRKHCFFYGRDQEVYQFKQAFDSGQKIKCLVASGIDGIGRKMYVVHALQDAGVLREYYEPFCISVNRDDQIEDIIIKISNLGFASYSLQDIVALSSLDEKIAILSELFSEIQNQQEHVIIYDHLSIIPFNQEPRFWFTKALENVRPEITVSILSSVKINGSYLQSHCEYFGIVIKEMPYSEWNGLLRTYSEMIGFPFTREEREYFKEILTGYPPQVIACVDMAKEHGISYTKDNARAIIQKVSHQVVDLLSVAFDEQNRQEGYELLAFLSRYGTMPMKTVYDIIKLHPQYRDIFIRLKTLTICRLVGYGEYIEISPSVADYVQRNNFKESSLIQKYLRERLNAFYEIIDSDVDEDFETLKLYLKYALIDGHDVPAQFSYATIYLSSIRELYNKGSYKRVIEIVKVLKENQAFMRFDQSVQEQIQGYYCLALARETLPEFYTEVEWYKKQEPFNHVEYNFLRGFMFRQKGNFEQAIERYKKILEERPRHKRALRELVSSYRGAEDYENFGDYAEANYNNGPENPYNIQPYFEFLIHKKTKTEKENKRISEMLATIDNIHRMTPIATYYELNAQYAIYIEDDIQRALQFLKEGEQSFPDSPYVLRTYFDCYELLRNLDGMKRILGKLASCAARNRATNLAYQRRCIIFDAYEKKALDSLILRIRQLKELTKSAQDNLSMKVTRILRG